jgi:hypothetical protein
MTVDRCTLASVLHDTLQGRTGAPCHVCPADTQHQHALLLEDTTAEATLSQSDQTSPRAGLSADQFSIATGTGPLRLQLSLADNGVQHNQTLHLLPRILGGAPPSRAKAPACTATPTPHRIPASLTDSATAKQEILHLLSSAHNQQNNGRYLAIWQFASDTQQEALELWAAVVAALDRHGGPLHGRCTNRPQQNRYGFVSVSTLLGMQMPVETGLARLGYVMLPEKACAG